jgi:hypothetical protein
MTPSITLNHIPILSFQHKKVLDIWTSLKKGDRLDDCGIGVGFVGGAWDFFLL